MNQQKLNLIRHVAIRAVFTSAEPSDQIPQRNVVVTQDRQMLIGRAPNHATKKPKAAEDNLYLISPIVSRKHATIIVSDLGVGSLSMVTHFSEAFTDTSI